LRSRVKIPASPNQLPVDILKLLRIAEMLTPSDDLGTFQADQAEAQAAFNNAHHDVVKAQKSIAGLAVGTFAAIIAVVIVILVLVPIITCCILKRQRKTRRKRISAGLAAKAKMPASFAPSPAHFPGPVYPQDRQGPVKERRAGEEWQEVPLNNGRV
jgi:hypothetical protein